MFIAVEVARHINKSWGDSTPYYMVLDTSDGSQEFWVESQLLHALIDVLHLKEVDSPRNSSDCFMFIDSSDLHSKFSVELGEVLCNSLGFEEDRKYGRDIFDFYRCVGDLFQMPAYIKHSSQEKAEKDGYLDLKNDLLHALVGNKKVLNTYLKNSKTSRSSFDKWINFNDDTIEFCKYYEDTDYYIY